MAKLAVLFLFNFKNSSVNSVFGSLLVCSSNTFLSMRLSIVASNPFMFGVPISCELSINALTIAGGSSVGSSLS